ncbi:MAG: Bax inhibitor-1/YccA family protein [Solirubrobacteraceae bacterium]
MSVAATARPSARSGAAGLFGRVMGLVALTVASATFGVWVARDSGSGGWFIAWLLAFGCLFGLNAANARGRTGLAVTLLLAFGLLVGISVAGTVNYYAATDPTAVRQAFAATTLSVAALGSVGYATRRDLSFLYRILFWLLVALLAAGVVLIFVHIPQAYVGWTVLGLVVFALYTVVDFNRLRRAGGDEALPLAAGIFLDVLNLFLLFLRVFSRSN